MPYDSPELDVEIIRVAYAERVKEAFKVFAENLSMGQNEKSTRERFLRSLELVRKARDLALEAIGGNGLAESAPAADGDGATHEAAEPLSAEDQALVEQALAGTTGQKAPPARRR